MSGIRLVIDEFRADVDQDPQGRVSAAGCGSTTATRTSPSERGQVAVEVRRRRQDRRRALRPRAGRHRRRAVRLPAGRPPEPAAHPTRWARTRITPPRRCASSPGRISRVAQGAREAIARAHASTTRRGARPARAQTIATGADDDPAPRPRRRRPTRLTTGELTSTTSSRPSRVTRQTRGRRHGRPRTSRSSAGPSRRDAAQRAAQV